ncbi:MAG: hypothetical protein ACE5HO_10115 [bacterium]
MDSYISLIGSIVIGGLFLLGLLFFQSDLKEHSFHRTNDQIVQEHALAIIDLLEWDFRKIGFNYPLDALAIKDTNSISYYVDLGNDGIIDTVHYTISDTGAASATPNPNDKILYRWSNGGPQVGVALGVTDFRLKYFDEAGNETSNVKQIKTIEITLELESTIPYNGQSSHFFWREKITPLNLQPL